MRKSLDLLVEETCLFALHLCLMSKNKPQFGFSGDDASFL